MASHVRLALLVALLAFPVRPAIAQGFLQSLFGSEAPPPARPASGYVRPQPAPGLFEDLFSPFPNEAPQPHERSTYRTLCVRMCDGFYFPISHATSSTNLTRDAEKCTASCGSEARLFYHPSSGSDVDAMLDMTGRAYTSYPTAFKYRKTLVQGCQCRPQPWTETERERHRAYAAAQPSGSQAATPIALSADSPEFNRGCFAWHCRDGRHCASRCDSRGTARWGNGTGSSTPIPGVSPGRFTAGRAFAEISRRSGPWPRRA